MGEKWLWDVWRENKEPVNIIMMVFAADGAFEYLMYLHII